MTDTRVMIVEDDSLTVLLIQNTLKNLGYKLGPVATSAQEAIAKALREKPDVILMDIILEGDSDGIEAAEAIRKQADIPVIFLTGISSKEFLQRARIAEPFGYLLKPFKEELLHANIEMALYKAQMDRERRELTRKLQASMDEIMELKQLLPICSHCKKIRNDQGYWEQLETYFHTNYHMDFSHGICQECLKIHYPDYDL